MAQKIITNFVGGIHQHTIEKVSRSYTQNMYPESVDATQSSTDKVLLSIYGSSTVATLPEGKCRGLFRASRDHYGNPVLFGCFGSGLYILHDNGDTVTYYKVGQVSNANNTPVHMTETGGEGSVNPHLIVVDGASVFAVDTTLLDADMARNWRSVPLPSRVTDSTGVQKITPTHVAYLYGYLIINDNGTDAFYTSIQYPFETTDDQGVIIEDIFYADPSVHPEYNGYGFITYAEWSTDNITALCSNGSYMYTFGPRSVQAWSYNDDLNKPFVSPDNAAESIGIKAPNSLAVCGPYTAWLASSDIGENGVYIMEGNQKKRVSTASIERQISKMSYPEDAVGQFWQENQHLFYAITFRTDNVTLVYDSLENEWHVRESYQYGIWRNQYAVYAYNKIIFGTFDGPELIKLDSEKWTEFDDNPIVRLRRGGMLYSDNSPFYCDAFNVTLNHGEISEVGVDPQVMMRYSTDANKWSDLEIGTMGYIGAYDHTLTWWNLGMAKYMTIEVSCSSPVDFAIVSAKINASPCNIF